jgi:hypothetical protein
MWQLIIALVIPFIRILISCWKEEDGWHWPLLYAMIVIGIASPIAIIQRRKRF